MRDSNWDPDWRVNASLWMPLSCCSQGSKRAVRDLNGSASSNITSCANCRNMAWCLEVAASVQGQLHSKQWPSAATGSGTL